MSDGPAIEVSGVVKRFGEVLALDGLDLTARHGQVLALLGPNGAGKTTLVRVLATLLKADAGSALVLGLDVRRDAACLRERIGLAGQYAAVDENLTGLENLTMVGRLYGARRRSAKARGRELLARTLASMSDEPPTAQAGLVKVSVRERTGAIVEAVHRLSEAGVGVDDLVLRRPTLDDVFLALTGHGAEEDLEEPDLERAA